MTGAVIYLINVMFFSQGVYKVILEIGPILLVSTFWGTMWPQNLPFQSQGGILGSGVAYRVCFWTPGSFFHYGEYIVLALVCLRQ